MATSVGMSQPVATQPVVLPDAPPLPTASAPVDAFVAPASSHDGLSNGRAAMITGLHAIGSGVFTPRSALYYPMEDGKSAVVVISDDAQLASHVQHQSPQRGSRYLTLWVRPHRMGLALLARHNTGCVVSATLPGKRRDGAGWHVQLPISSTVQTKKVDMATHGPLEGDFTGTIEASVPNARGTAFKRQKAPFYGTFTAVYCADLQAFAPPAEPGGLKGLLRPSPWHAWANAFCLKLRQWESGASGGVA